MARRCLSPQLLGKSDRFVTFLDFVQSLAVRQIRIDLEVPLVKIRQGIENARKHYDVEFPLAMDHTAYLYAGELIIRKAKEKDEQLIQVSGKEAHHQMLQQVVRVYMKDLSFGTNDLAYAYQAFIYNNVDISMNPQFRFGEPLLRSCGYSARALWESARAEGSIELAAMEHGVTAAEVETAYRYYESLKIPKAA